MIPAPRIRVLLLVGNHLLCKSLARIIQQKPDMSVCGQSTDLSDVALLVEKAESDVTLLGSLTASVLNRQCATRIRDLNSKARILMIGMGPDEDSFLRAVRAGVRGYLLNDASAVDLIAAIRAVARGEAVCPPQLCKVLFDSVAGAREFIPSVGNMGLRLTRRQQELVPMIARGLTNKEIASHLNLSEQTVKNHIHRMLRKTGANDRLQVIALSRVEDFPN